MIAATLASRVPQSLRFPVCFLTWSLALFALLKLDVFMATVVVPLTEWQAHIAAFYGGPVNTGIEVTTACSAVDVMALCVGSILASQVAWSRRLWGSLGGIVLILVANIVRIASLSQVDSSSALFDTLHLQVWPAILSLVALTYVMSFMYLGGERSETPRWFSKRFLISSVVFLGAFGLCGPWIASSTFLLTVGGWVSHATATSLQWLSVPVVAQGNTLITERGSFIVTPECVATALIPLFAAAVFSSRASLPLRMLAVLLAPVAFFVLAVVRLMLLAVPAAVATSPLFLVHGFHQLVLSVVVLLFVAMSHHRPAEGGKGSVLRRTVRVLLIFAVCGIVLGPLAGVVLRAIAQGGELILPNTLTELSFAEDSQGALAILPAFQIGFLAALCAARNLTWKTTLKLSPALLLSQLLLLAIMGELAHRGYPAHSLLVRAWAVLIPLGLVAGARLFSLRGMPVPSHEAYGVR